MQTSSAPTLAIDHGRPSVASADTGLTQISPGSRGGVLTAFAECCRAFNETELAALAALGMTPEMLGFDTARKLFKVMVASVVFLAAGRFEFSRYFQGDGMRTVAAIIVCRDVAGDVCDLVAWRRPDKLASWRGQAALLGEEQVWAPRVDPLLVHPDVVSWLKADRRGVVMINPAFARPILKCAAPLAVNSKNFKLQLECALADPAPRIIVMTKEGTANGQQSAA